MITLNVDFSLLNKFFGVNPAKIPQYANKSFEEIMKIEASQGNEKAENYQEILSNPQKIAEIFKLTNIENKFIILQNLSEEDLDNLLPLLKKDQLTMGLNFFTEEKLISMCQDLPMEEIIGMVFEKFNLFDVMQFMDESDMDRILTEPDAERKYAQKYFEGLDESALQELMVSALGSDFREKDKKENIDYLKNMDEGDYQTFMLSLDKTYKMNLLNGMVQQEDKMLFLFKEEELTKPMEMLMKDDKIKMMSKLDPEFLVPMIQELPLDLTQIVLTQIDPKEFSEVLAKDFQDILSSVVLFSK